MIATAAFKETVDRIAGRPTRDKSFAAALIVFALLAHSLRPAVAGSLGALRKSVRVVITQGFRLRHWFAARGSLIAARSRDVVAEAAGRDTESAGLDQVGNGDRSSPADRPGKAADEIPRSGAPNAGASIDEIVAVPDAPPVSG